MNSNENKKDAPEESKAVSVEDKKEIERTLLRLNPLATFQDEEVKYPVFLPSAVPASPDAPYVSPLCIVGDLLRVQGVPEGNIKVGLATHQVLNSAAYGFPMGEEILDEAGEGVRILNDCLNLTPPKHTLELPKLPLEVMLRERNQLKGRSVVCFNGKGFQKDSSLINLYLQRQLLKSQETVPMKHAAVFQELAVEGPTSVVVANPDRNNRVLTHPSFIHLAPEPAGPADRRFLSVERYETDNSFAWVRASLERLNYHPVAIPFINQLRQHLISSKVKYPQERCDTLARMLSIITILNNPGPLLKSELFARFLGLGAGKAPLKESPAVSSKGGELISTRADYYYLWSVMNDVWPSRDDSLNELERRIFKVIKDKNLEGLKEKTFVDLNNPTEVLLTIMQDEKCWIPQDKVFEYVSRDAGEPVGVSSLYRTLKGLAAKEVILSRDDPKSKNRKLFAVCVLDITQNIQLPHPSEIRDGILDGKPIQVLNPLSGMVETI
jgi:hypothetical protein